MYKAGMIQGRIIYCNRSVCHLVSKHYHITCDMLDLLLVGTFDFSPLVFNSYHDIMLV